MYTIKVWSFIDYQEISGQSNNFYITARLASFACTAVLEKKRQTPHKIYSDMLPPELGRKRFRTRCDVIGGVNMMS